MASPAFGKIEEFDSKEEEWLQYVERLGHYFVANGVEGNEEKKGDLPHLGWPENVQIVAELGSPCDTK